jgi:hypothetical protein
VGVWIMGAKCLTKWLIGLCIWSSSNTDGVGSFLVGGRHGCRYWEAGTSSIFHGRK